MSKANTVQQLVTAVPQCEEVSVPVPGIQVLWIDSIGPQPAIQARALYFATYNTMPLTSSLKVVVSFEGSEFKVKTMKKTATFHSLALLAVDGFRLTPRTPMQFLYNGRIYLDTDKRTTLESVGIRNHEVIAAERVIGGHNRVTRPRSGSSSTGR